MNNCHIFLFDLIKHLKTRLFFIIKFKKDAICKVLQEIHFTASASVC